MLISLGYSLTVLPDLSKKWKTIWKEKCWIFDNVTATLFGQSLVFIAAMVFLWV